MGHGAIFTLSFEGARTDQHEIDLYDVAYALMGFQRSLALTTHLVINDKIITQAPSLKGASIFARPPEDGSWKLMAGISFAATGLFQLGTAPKDSPIGHLVYSAYDYVIKESLGVHVDYNKSLGQQYEELQVKGFKGPVLAQHRLDSLVEKCEPAIKEMHRPIVGEETALKAVVSATIGEAKLPIGTTFDRVTYEYLAETIRDKSASSFRGRVSSYNSNTYKGRVFVPSEGRPLAFELQTSARGNDVLQIVTQSLTLNTLFPKDRTLGYFQFVAHAKRSKTGTIKSLEINAVFMLEATSATAAASAN